MDIISLLIGFFVLYRYWKKTAYLLLLISFTIPFSVKAVCKYSLEVNTNLVIDARNAIFLPGQEFNIKVKQLVGDDTSTVTNGYDFKDQLITAFHYSDVEPVDSNKEDKNIVSISESNYLPRINASHYPRKAYINFLALNLKQLLHLKILDYI